MRIVDAVRTRLRGIIQAATVDRELDAELEFHVEQQVAENLAAGMSPGEARRAARRTVGHVDRIREECRDMRKVAIVELVGRDVRYALRTLRRSPLFAAASIGTLALGIGANTMIFSVFHSVVLRPVAYPHPETLSVLQCSVTRPGRPTNTFGWSYPKFEDLRRLTGAFQSIDGFSRWNMNLTGAGEAERVGGELVTGGYFATLGVHTTLGRTILPDDDGVGRAQPVAVISHGLWQRKFGGDPAIVGRSISLNRLPFTIVGVASEQFRGESGAAQVWVPVALSPMLMNNPARLEERMNHWLTLIARLRQGVSHTQADADLKRAIAQMEAARPSDRSRQLAGAVWGGFASPLADAKVDPVLRKSLVVLLGAVVCVLLITCLNLANLLMSRALNAQREIAVRIAIGASRAALVRQLITESVFVGICGGLLGLFVATLGVQALAALQPDGLVGSMAPFVNRLDLDGIELRQPAVLAFTLCVSVFAGLLFGIIPALRAGRLDLTHAMKTADAGWLRGTRTSRGTAPRGVLLTTQIALAVVLLVGAGLLLSSLSRLLAVNLGFDAQHVLALRLDLPRAHYDDDERRVLFEAITNRIRSLPGVESVAVASTVPLRGQSESTPAVIDRVADVGGVGIHVVGPEYFAALRIPLLRGRLLTDQDSASSMRVAVINETFARRQWPGEDPIGHHLTFGLNGWGDPGQEAEIIGVVGDAKYQLIDMAVESDVYLTYRQRPPVATAFVVRTSGDLLSLAPVIRHEVAQADPNVPVFDVTTMNRIVTSATARTRFSGVLLSIFAGLALILVATGLYATVACSVATRTRELGVRLALGAKPSSVIRLVVSETALVCAIGLAIGVVAAVLSGRALAGLLYQIAPTHGTTLLAVMLLVAVTTALASYVPARRAARVDPLIALRHE
jgi:putative ABC transport system permease protein